MGGFVYCSAHLDESFEDSCPWLVTELINDRNTFSVTTDISLVTVWLSILAILNTVNRHAKYGSNTG
jgi:hypothetical protein